MRCREVALYKEGFRLQHGGWWRIRQVKCSYMEADEELGRLSAALSEKERATHSSVLAWRIPGTGEPGGLLSMGSHRVRHDWSALAGRQAVQLCIEGLRGPAPGPLENLQKAGVAQWSRWEWRGPRRVKRQMGPDHERPQRHWEGA